jgi:hypothetical protein
MQNKQLMHGKNTEQVPITDPKQCIQSTYNVFSLVSSYTSSNNIGRFGLSI